MLVSSAPSPKEAANSRNPQEASEDAQKAHEEAHKTRHVPECPSCPGKLKVRKEGPLSKLPPGLDVFEAVVQIRADKNLTEEVAYLELLRTYDLSLSTLSQISSLQRKKLDVSSNMTYHQVAPYVWLNPDAAGRDMQRLEVFRSRIPKEMFQEITRDVDDAIMQYGPLDKHDNEEARSRFISSSIVCLFGSAIVNKPEGLLETEFSKKGKIVHHFVALDSVSIVFIEVKKLLTLGNTHLDVKGQVLAECAACHYANFKEGHWVPVLGILCDGSNFEFFVLDSADQLVYSSGRKTGIFSNESGDELKMLISIKEVTEHLLDWFVMGFINGIRALGSKSARRSQYRKLESTEQWENAHRYAEHAQWSLREAAVIAREGQIKEAERMAAAGIENLKSSVSQLPQYLHRERMSRGEMDQPQHLLLNQKPSTMKMLSNHWVLRHLAAVWSSARVSVLVPASDMQHHPRQNHCLY